MARHAAGTEVSLEVVRDGVPLALPVTLGERPAPDQLRGFGR